MSKSYIYAAFAMAFLTVTTICYMEGKIATQQGLQAHDAGMEAKIKATERRYNILAQNADYVSVIVADKQWRKEIGQ